jgi:isovaleryl-CoA dehydrogenase
MLSRSGALGRCFFSAGAASAFRPSLFAPTAEHQALRDLVRKFAVDEVEPQALVHNREERFNLPLFRKLGELGLLGLTADPAYGGSGLDATAVCVAHEELAAVDPAFCLSFLAHSLLFVNNLSVNGSSAQRAAFLPKACSGEALCGMAMSEPGAGTDVLAMATTARRDGGHYVLNGRKLWITNGASEPGQLGDAFLMYARDAVPVAGKAKSFSLFLVEKGMPGFSLGQIIKDKCGMRASNTTELVLEDVRIPAATHLVRVAPSSLLLAAQKTTTTATHPPPPTPTPTHPHPPPPTPTHPLSQTHTGRPRLATRARRCCT